MKKKETLDCYSAVKFYHNLIKQAKYHRLKLVSVVQSDCWKFQPWWTIFCQPN